MVLLFYKEIGDIVYIETGQIKKEDPSAIADVTFPFMTDFSVVRQRIVIRSSEGDKCIVYLLIIYEKISRLCNKFTKVTKVQ